jgi:hypothetical protein
MFSQWLNPPTDTWPEHQVLLALYPDDARLVATTLAAAADTAEYTNWQRADEQRRLAHQIQLATLTPAEADERDPNRYDFMHPANQMSRLFVTALNQLSCWSGPVSLVMNAMERAAAIAASRDGEDGVREVILAARRKATRLERTVYGPLSGPTVGPTGPV